MQGKIYEFHAAIEAVPDKGGAYIRFPHDIKKEFGKGRVKVQDTFDGEPYCYIIVIRKYIRSKIGKQPGDDVFVTVTPLLETPVES